MSLSNSHSPSHPIPPHSLFLFCSFLTFLPSLFNYFIVWFSSISHHLCSLCFTFFYFNVLRLTPISFPLYSLPIFTHSRFLNFLYIFSLLSPPPAAVHSSPGRFFSSAYFITSFIYSTPRPFAETQATLFLRRVWLISTVSFLSIFLFFFFVWWGCRFLLPIFFMNVPSFWKFFTILYLILSNSFS